MMRESDFHQVPSDKTTAVIMKQEEKKAAVATVVATVAAPVEVVKQESKKEVQIIKEPTPAPKVEKKLQRQTIKAPSPQPPVIDLVDSREINRKEQSPPPAVVREASVASNRSVERINRDSKRSERRDKSERDDDKKRDKERRRNKREASPQYETYYKNDVKAVYAAEARVLDRVMERISGVDRERDLSSVSNSSHGSPTRARSMEPPMEPLERDLKRRKIEAPTKSGSDKRDKNKAPKKDKQSDESKEQRREKRKKDRNDEGFGSEKRSRKDDDKQHKNGDEPSPRVSKHHHVRESSPIYDEPREKSYKSSRSRSGY